MHSSSLIQGLVLKKLMLQKLLFDLWRWTKTRFSFYTSTHLSSFDIKHSLLKHSPSFVRLPVKSSEEKRKEEWWEERKYSTGHKRALH